MVDRESLSPDVKAAVDWIAYDLPNIVNGLSTSLAGLKNQLKHLTEEVESIEAFNEGLVTSVEVVRRRLGLAP